MSTQGELHQAFVTILKKSTDEFVQVNLYHIGNDSYKVRIEVPGRGIFGASGTLGHVIEYVTGFDSQSQPEPNPWDHDATTINGIVGAECTVSERAALIDTIMSMDKVSQAAQFILDNGDVPIVRGLVLSLTNALIQGVINEAKKAEESKGKGDGQD